MRLKQFNVCLPPSFFETSASHTDILHRTHKVSFGCVLNDTTMTKSVRVTNNSVVNCAFTWSFLEDVDEGRQGATARRPYIPVNQVRNDSMPP